MENEIPLKEKVDMLYNALEEQKISEIKTKKIKIPRKAKAKKSKIKKGWIGVLKIDENGHISGEKQKVEGFTVTLKDGTYHASDGREILFWEGKFPVIIQPTWKENPLKIRKEEGEKNETYGQKYIKAKILRDTITVKKPKPNILIWLLVAGAALFAINYFMGA